jgi:UDP-glucose 4-epimerase
MKILITGGAGLIGSNLAKKFLEKNNQVIVIDNLSTGRLNNIKSLTDNKKFTFIEGDILDSKLVHDIVKKVDYVFHFAAAVGVNYILENPLKSLITNLRGTEIVLEAVHKYSKKIIIASTSEVYGKQIGKKLFSEDSDIIFGPPSIGRWSYAAGKLIDEFLALSYFKTFKTKVIIVRFFNVIGPKQLPDYGMVVPRFIEQALENKDITIYGSGKQTRTFSYVEDINDSLLKLIQCKRKNIFGQIFNLGGTQEITITNLAKKIIKISGSKSKLLMIPYKKAFKNNYEDMLNRKPSLEKIKTFIKYKSKFDINLMIKEIVKFKKNEIN